MAEFVLVVFSIVWVLGTTLAVHPSFFYPYETLKDFICVLGAWSLSGIAIGSAMTTGPAAQVRWVLLFIACWWLVCTLRAERHDIALRVAGRLVLCLAAGLLIAGRQEAIMAVVVGCLLDALYGWGRLLKNWRFFGEKKDQHNFLGLQGNANYAGSLHMIGIFCAWHLGGWWCLAAGISLIALVRSKCRSALYGAFVGIAVVAAVADHNAVTLLGFVGVLAIVIYFAVTAFDRKDPFLSFFLRFAVWRAVFMLVLRKPLFGLGPDNLKIVTPQLIRTLREQGTKIPADWSTRKAHSDWLQIAVDCGLPGLVAWAALVCVAIVNMDRAPVLGAGVVAVAAAGFFFHPLYLPQVLVPVSILLGNLLGVRFPEPIVFAGAQFWAALAIWAVLGLLIVLPAARLATYRHGLQRSLTNQCAGMGKMLAKNPRDTLGNLLMVHAALQHEKLYAASAFSTRALTHYDGESKYQDVLKTHAAVMAACGAKEVAAALMAEATSYEVGNKA
jgi:O-antigen ligase